MKKWTLKKRWFLAVSIILHALLLLAAYMFQGLVFPFIKAFGLVPLLLPIVSTGIAVYRGRVAGGISGIFAGILCDFSFNATAGYFMVFLTLTGLVVGTLADTVMARRFITYMICCAAVLALAAFSQMFTLLFFEDNPVSPLLSRALAQTVYSLVYAVPIWFFVRALGKRVNELRIKM